MDLNDYVGYTKLKDLLIKLDEANNRIFYLAVAPEHFSRIVHSLGNEELIQRKEEGFRRVVIEKPFGRDLKTATQLNQELMDLIQEDQIYQIDHYLAKEMIQNIMVIRFANAFFEPLWNNKYVDHIQISSTETVGVGDRGDYYDNFGTLRDMLQNHMLQLLTLIAMAPPVT